MLFGSCWSLVRTLCNRGGSLEGRQGHLMLSSTYDLPTHRLANLGVCMWSFPELFHWACGAAASVPGCVAGNLSARCPSPLEGRRLRKFNQGQGGLFSLPRQWIDSINWFVLLNRRKSSLSFHTWASLTQAPTQESWLSRKAISRTFCFFLEWWWDQGLYLWNSLWEPLEI